MLKIRSKVSMPSDHAFIFPNNHETVFKHDNFYKCHDSNAVCLLFELKLDVKSKPQVIVDRNHNVFSKFVENQSLSKLYVILFLFKRSIQIGKQTLASTKEVFVMRCNESYANSSVQTENKDEFFNIFSVFYVSTCMRMIQMTSLYQLQQHTVKQKLAKPKGVSISRNAQLEELKRIGMMFNENYNKPMIQVQVCCLTLFLFI